MREKELEESIENLHKEAHEAKLEAAKNLEALKKEESIKNELLLKIQHLNEEKSIFQ